VLSQTQVLCHQPCLRLEKRRDRRLRKFGRDPSSASDNAPGAIHHGDLPRRSHDQRAKQPAISANAARCRQEPLSCAAFPPTLPARFSPPRLRWRANRIRRGDRVREIIENNAVWPRSTGTGRIAALYESSNAHLKCLQLHKLRPYSSDVCLRHVARFEAGSLWTRHECQERSDLFDPKAEVPASRLTS
jgi:hypothetical protein